MRIGICNDIRDEGIKAENVLREEMVLVPDRDTIQLYSSSDVVADLMENRFQCDVMVMNIDLKREDLDGIQLGKHINEKAPDCQIVYLAHEFVPDVYETEHCYFVLKNDMQVLLPQAMKKAKYLHDKATEGKMVELISGGHKVYITQKDIIYIEKEQRKIRIYTRNRTYDSYQSLAEIGRQLDEKMIRCHGSYVINLKHVIKIGKNSLIMENEKEIPIGKTYLNQVKKEYLQYCQKEIKYKL